MLERYYPINQILESENFLAIQWLTLFSLPRARVQSPVREPRFHKSSTWPKMKINMQINAF